MHDEWASYRVLIVEDDELCGQLLAMLLGHLGYSVTSAKTVAEAIDKFVVQTTQILISDISLPDGDGIELITRLRAAHGNRFCAVALSGHGSREDIVRAVKAGFDAYLTKPATTLDIDTHIQRLGRNLAAQPS